MDSEAHVDVARLFDMLDELDALYADSVTAVENRLAAAHSALEQAREFRARQSEDVIPKIAAADEQSSDHDALLDDVSQYMRRIEELELLLKGMADKDARIVELEGVAEEIGRRDHQIAELTMENQRLHDMLVQTDRILPSGADASLDDLRQQIQEREAQQDLLREQLEETGAALLQREERIRVLEEQAASRKEETSQLEALREEIQERDAQLEILRQELEQSRQQNEETAQLRAQLAQLDAQIADAQTRYNQVKQALEAHETDSTTLDTLRGERDGLLESVEALKQQNAGHEEAFHAVSAERDALRDAINTLETEKAARQSELSAVKESLDERNIQEKALRDTAAALQAEYDALNQEFGAYKKERDTEVVSLRAQLKDAQEADNRVRTLQQALDERAAHMTGLEKALAKVEEQRDKLELEVKMLVDQVQGLQVYQDEAEQLRRRVEKLEIELEEELAVIIRLQAQLAAPGRVQAQEPVVSRQPKGDVVPQDKVSAVTAAAGKNRRQRKQMGEILVEAGVLTKEQLAKVIRAQNADPKRKLGAVVVEYGYANEEVIAAALAAQLHIRYIENLEREMELESVNLAPTNLVRHHRCVPVYMDGGQLLLAMANPLDLIAIDDIELATNARVEPAVATPTDIDNVIEKFFEREPAISQPRR